MEWKFLNNTHRDQNRRSTTTTTTNGQLGKTEKTDGDESMGRGRMTSQKRAVIDELATLNIALYNSNALEPASVAV